MNTKYVALIRPDDSVEIREELPVADAPARYRMLCLQVELYAQEGKHGYRTYMGDVWPPEGMREARRKGKVYLEAVPVEAPAPEPEPAP